MMLRGDLLTDIPPFFQKTEQANKVANVSPVSSQAQATEEAVAISSPAVAAAKSTPQLPGSSAPGYYCLQLISWYLALKVKS